MIRVVREPEYILNFIRYVSKTGSSTLKEIVPFLPNQKSYLKDYIEFSIALGLMQRLEIRNRIHLIATPHGRRVASTEQASQYFALNVPQYRLYCSELLRQLDESLCKVDRMEIKEKIDTTSNPMNPEGFTKKTLRHNISRYKFWDYNRGIRGSRQSPAYSKRNLNEVLEAFQNSPVTFTINYITGGGRITEKQQPLFSLLLIVMIGQKMNRCIRETEVEQFLQSSHQGVESGFALPDLVDYLWKIGIPVRKVKRNILLTGGVQLAASKSEMAEISRLICDMEPGSYDWNSFSQLLYNHLFDFGLFGDRISEQISKWIELVENMSVAPLRPIPTISSYNDFISLVKHEGDFNSMPSSPIINIFSTWPKKTNVGEKLRRLLSIHGEMTNIDVADRENFYLLKPFFYSPLTIGRIPIFTTNKGSVYITPIGGVLLQNMGSADFNELLSILLYYSLPHLLVATEMVRSEKVDVFTEGSCWWVESKGNRKRLHKAVDKVIESEGFDVWNEHYSNDEEACTLIEKSMIETLFGQGFVKLEGNVLKRTRTLWHISQTNKGMMFYQLEGLRRRLGTAISQ